MTGLKRPAGIVGCLVLLLALTGCGVFRAHRPMTVQVVDGETRQPLSNVKIGVSYPNMLDFTAPRPTSRTTDERGVATLRIGVYHCVSLSAERDGYRQADRHDVT